MQPVVELAGAIPLFWAEEDWLSMCKFQVIDG